MARSTPESTTPDRITSDRASSGEPATTEPPAARERPVPLTETPQPIGLPEGQTQLRVGRLTKAHGLKGALKVELFTDEPEKRFVPGAVFTLQVPTSSDWHGKTLELSELRFYNGHPVAFFTDVPDRSAAETLAKAILWITEEISVAAPEEDAWYDYQLVGLTVVRDGKPVGTIKQVDHLPAQDLLIVKTPTGDVMVPFVAAIVPSVDLQAGVVTVTPPIGLFEEIPDDGPDETHTGIDGADAVSDADVVSDADAIPTADETDEPEDSVEKA